MFITVIKLFSNQVLLSPWLAAQRINTDKLKKRNHWKCSKHSTRWNCNFEFWPDALVTMVVKLVHTKQEIEWTFLKASDDHRPIALMFCSNIPFVKAVVTAPILKLCPLYCLLSKPHQFKNKHSWFEKDFRDNGVPFMKVKRGPELGVLTWKNSKRAWTGQTF